MTNLNVIGGVERFKFNNQSERPFYQDEQQFYLFHPPMPTENGKLLQQYFNERTGIENEKYELREKEKELVNKFDSFSHYLMKVRKRETCTVEEEIAKEEEIKAIEDQIQKIAKEQMKLKEEVEGMEKEIDRVNEKINDMIQIVIEDEHKLNQQEEKLQKINDDKKVESLIAQL